MPNVRGLSVLPVLRRYDARYAAEFSAGLVVALATPDKFEVAFDEKEWKFDPAKRAEQEPLRTVRYGCRGSAAAYTFFQI